MKLYSFNSFCYKSKEGGWKLIKNGEDILKDFSNGFEVTDCVIYSDIAFKFATKEEGWKLIKDGKDILKDFSNGFKVIDCYLDVLDGSFSLRTKEEGAKLIKQGIDLTENARKTHYIISVGTIKNRPEIWFRYKDPKIGYDGGLIQNGKVVNFAGAIDNPSDLEYVYPQLNGNVWLETKKQNKWLLIRDNQVVDLSKWTKNNKIIDWRPMGYSNNICFETEEDGWKLIHKDEEVLQKNTNGQRVKHVFTSIFDEIYISTLEKQMVINIVTGEILFNELNNSDVNFYTFYSFLPSCNEMCINYKKEKTYKLIDLFTNKDILQDFAKDKTVLIVRSSNTFILLNTLESGWELIDKRTKEVFNIGEMFGKNAFPSLHPQNGGNDSVFLNIENQKYAEFEFEHS